MGLRLTLLSSGDRAPASEISYWFEQQRVVLGRGAGADVRLPHPTISKLHAVIELRGEDYFIADSGSTNGTRVNDLLLVAEKPKLLHDGDRIAVGCCTLSVHTAVVVAEPSSAERTAELARRLLREVLEPSQAAPGPPELVVVDGPDQGKRIFIPSPPSLLKVGREPSCQLVLSDAAVSREHMEIVRDLDGVLVRNLDSKNGITIGEQQVAERRLKNGTEIVLGSTRLRFEDPAEVSIGRMMDRPDEKLPPGRVDRPEASGRERGDAALERDHEVPPRSPGRRSQGGPPFPVGAELLIYLLATVILVLSAAGLVILLRSG